MNALATLRPVTRAEIMELEGLMVALARARDPDFVPGNTDAIAPVKHHFAPGLYVREIFIPAGLRIIGKLHRTAHIMTIAQGSGIIWSEFGAFEYAAPLTKPTLPGAKNVLWAREDTVLLTCHATDTRDLADLEREIIAPSYEALDLERRKELQ